MKRLSLIPSDFAYSCLGLVFLYHWVFTTDTFWAALNVVGSNLLPFLVIGIAMDARAMLSRQKTLVPVVAKAEGTTACCPQEHGCCCKGCLDAYSEK